MENINLKISHFARLFLFLIALDFQFSVTFWGTKNKKRSSIQTERPCLIYIEHILNMCRSCSCVSYI